MENLLNYKKYDLKGKRVGVPKEYLLEGLNPEIKKAWDLGISWFESAGSEIVEISLPNTESALPTYYVIAPAEGISKFS